MAKWSIPMFKLSSRSLGKLEGVNPLLVNTVKRAIELTKVDFGVIFGVRSLETQKKLYESGRSQTMKSKHLIQPDGTAHAVDLMAYDGSDPSWEIVMYDDIADAMKAAAKETGAKIRWGAAWTVDNIAEWDDSMQEAMNDYIDIRRKAGRTPFIDGPHFELN
jgi:peptidoglycan L-alanyl-D-glutamate endopeptidase CwlK